MDVLPTHTIHAYTDSIYKVVTFKGRRDGIHIGRLHREDFQTNDTKLANNFSRARSMVLQYALCNPWEYFFTGTLDRAKFNRYDLDTYASQLMQWIRDKRKFYNAKFQVLLVPERHKDGAWHIHGLVHDLPDFVLTPFVPPAPERLIRGKFLNWPDYMDKFGFCSLAPIRDPVATAFYITKYISKDLSQRAGDVGKHLYFHSRPLKKAQKASDIYMYNRELDAYCVNDYDFCKTGMVTNENFAFPFAWDEPEETSSSHFVSCLVDPLENFPAWTIDPFYEQPSLFDEVRA